MGIRPGDRVRLVAYGEVYGRVNKVTKAGWVHVTIEGRFPTSARWRLRDVELAHEQNAAGDCHRRAQGASDYVFPERQAYPIPTARCARYALTMVTWPNNEPDAVEVAESVLARYGSDPALRDQALSVLERYQLPMAANRRGDRFRVGTHGPIFEELGHGRARKVGTSKQFTVSHRGRQVTARSRSGGEQRYQGPELDQLSERYYVWVLDDHQRPLVSEEPIGPLTLTAAKGNARIAADRGEHDRAVTYGLDPESKTFRVVRVYSKRGGRRRA